MKYFFYIFVLSALFLHAGEYKFGQGYKFSKELHLGGYFSIDYSQGKEKEQFRLDDVAFLIYGDINRNLSYLVELEAAPFYIKNYDTGESKTDTTFHLERIYVNYTYSQILNVRVGKQITPISYWAQEPINVLRDTSSSPLYSYKMFPKLFSGIDLFGYLDRDNTLQYNLFGQMSDDVDEGYINIKNNFFIGASLEWEISDEVSFGGAIAYYEAKETDIQNQRDVNLFQADGKYDNYPFLLQSEWAYNLVEEKNINEDIYQFSGYVQGVYNFNMQHAVVTRYDYFYDSDENKEINIGLLGYSYRPMPSVSIKGEYQFNSSSYYSKALISFAVLF